MADLTTAHKFNGEVLPEHAVQTQWPRLQPILDAKHLRALYLFGLSLTSGEPDAEGRRQTMTDDLLEVFVERAVEMAEQEARMYITPTVVEERMPHDIAMYNNCMNMVSKHRPISAVLRWSIQTADQTQIYDVPLERVDISGGVKGQLNVDPMTISQAGLGSAVTSPFALGVLSVWASRTWTPWMWTLKLMVGWPDGLVPVCVNDLIGCIAAQEILSELAATHARRTSVSIGVDGYSQGVSGPGAQLYKQRMDELTEKRRRALGQCRSIVGSKIFASQV